MFTSAFHSNDQNPEITPHSLSTFWLTSHLNKKAFSDPVPLYWFFIAVVTNYHKQKLKAHIDFLTLSLGWRPGTT